MILNIENSFWKSDFGTFLQTIFFQFNRLSHHFIFLFQLRLTLGPPQQLVDNYNAQLGVTVPKTEVGNGLSRSESIHSNGDCR